MTKRRLIFNLVGTVIDLNNYHSSVQNLFNYLVITYTDSDINNYIKYMSKYEKNHSRYALDTYLAYLTKHTGIPLIQPDKDY